MERLSTGEGSNSLPLDLCASEGSNSLLDTGESEGSNSLLCTRDTVPSGTVGSNSNVSLTFTFLPRCPGSGPLRDPVHPPSCSRSMLCDPRLLPVNLASASSRSSRLLGLRSESGGLDGWSRPRRSPMKERIVAARLFCPRATPRTGLFLRWSPAAVEVRTLCTCACVRMSGDWRSGARLGCPPPSCGRKPSGGPV